MKNCVTTRVRSVLIVLNVVAGICCAATEVRASCRVDYILCPECTAVSDGHFSAPPGSRLTFKAKTVGCSVNTVVWTVTKEKTDDDDGWTKTYSYSLPPIFVFPYEFPDLGQYTVHVHLDPPSDFEKAVSLEIRENDFTVNILPSAGCTVLAGDGGVDDYEPEGNGIICSGGMAADDPLCTEQFQNSQIASLKVVPDEGHGFTGWIINGAHITLASAEPLFLSTMPLLA